MTNPEFASILVGYAMVAVGCTFAWGWPVALVAIGLIIIVWQLVKQVAQS